MSYDIMYQSANTNFSKKNTGFILDLFKLIFNGSVSCFKTLIHKYLLQILVTIMLNLWPESRNIRTFDRMETPEKFGVP